METATVVRVIPTPRAAPVHRRTPAPSPDGEQDALGQGGGEGEHRRQPMDEPDPVRQADCRRRAGG